MLHAGHVFFMLAYLRVQQGQIVHLGSDIALRGAQQAFIIVDLLFQFVALRFHLSHLLAVLCAQWQAEEGK